MAPTGLNDPSVVPGIAQVETIRMEGHLHVFGERDGESLHKCQVGWFAVRQVVFLLGILGQIEQENLRFCSLFLLFRF